MLNHLIALLVVLCLCGQCGAQPSPSISGRVTVIAGWRPTVYLVQPHRFSDIATSYSGTVVDSAVIESDGQFSFVHLPPLQQPSTLFQLCIQRQGERYPNQLSDDQPEAANYMPIALAQGEKVQITTQSDHFQGHFKITHPSPDNQALLALRDIRRQGFGQKTLALASLAGQPEETVLLAHEDIQHQFQVPLMAFADSSLQVWAALVAIRWVSPAGDFERIPEFLEGQCRKWNSQLPDQLFVRQLCQLGRREQLPVLIGDLFPEAALPMIAGDTVLLRSLLGHKLTIIDIWASWCMPCRGENKDVLLPLWDKYKDAGLQIIGYSIDRSPAAWAAAIAKDKASWPHASHLQGDAAPLLDTLRITTIPANYILDAEGRILAKNLHGVALMEWVAERL